MSTLTTRRFAKDTANSDYPHMQVATWQSVTADHPGALELTGHPGWWALITVEDPIVDIPPGPPPQYDEFGDLMPIGGGPAGPMPVDTMPLRAGLVEITQAEWQALKAALPPFQY